MTASSSAPLLELRHVGIRYSEKGWLRNKGGRWVLKDVSFTLYQGESLGILGRNGTGKSTLLRVMAGILAPDAGSVSLQAGRRASLLTLRAGFLPQLSGRDNVYLSAMLQGLTRREVQERMQDILDFSELAEHIDAPLETYSDGMRARLGFAISLNIRPDILLLDEVLGVGDAAFRKKSADALRQRIRTDQTAVLVSHNPDTVRDLCTRAIWIDGGYVQAAGAVDEVLAAYEQHLLPVRQAAAGKTGA